MVKTLSNRLSRKRRIRSRVRGTAQRPRMTVYRSLTQITVQVIDDSAGKTLVAASTRHAKGKANTDGAKKLGALIAEKAKSAGVSSVVFDRNAYKYHGRIKALADAAREAGLQF